MKGRDSWSESRGTKDARRFPGTVVRMGTQLLLSTLLAVLLIETSRTDVTASVDAQQPASRSTHAVLPIILVDPTEFLGLLLGPDGSDSVAVTIANLGDVPLDYTMSVTNDDVGSAHVRVNGAPNYSSIIAPLGPPEVVTIAYDAIGLPVASVHNWRIEVTSNDPATDPGLGGVPIDIRLEVITNDGTMCTLCGDLNGNGTINTADLVFLSSYLFGEGPPPPDPTCADLDDLLLPTIRDQLYLADFLFSGGPPPLCPPANPPCSPLPGGSYQLTYDPAFAANRDTDTLLVNLVNLAGVRALVVPLQIRVDGAIPIIGDVQLYNDGGWNTPSALINPVGAPSGSVLLAFNAPTGSVPPGDRLIAAIEITVPYSPSGRLISLDIGDAFPPTVDARNVNYAVAIDDDPALNCWELELVPLAGSDVDCSRSFTEPCLTACPAGDEAFSVFLRDPAGLPVVGSNDVWLDFSACPSVIPCPSESDWPLVYPAAPSSGSGRAVFLVNAGGCDDGCLVQVMSSCGPIATVPFKSFDLDGDLSVGPLDYDGSLCNDFDCSGAVRENDLRTFTPHVSHACDPDVRTLIRPRITVTPDTGVAIGDAVGITVEIRNHTASNVTIDSVVLYVSSFDLGDFQDRIDVQPEPFNSTLNTGDVTVVTTTYVLPPLFRALPSAASEPLECVTAEIFTSAAAAPVVAEHCERVIRQACTPDTAFEFRYHVPVIPVYYWPFVLMPTGFSALVVPDVHTYFTEADSVMASVSIDPPVATLGDSGTVIMLFCDDEQCANEITERRFRAIYAHQRGDVNDDCRITAADVIYLVNYVFKSGKEPLPYPGIGNIDCKGDVNSADVITLVNFVFKGADPLLGDCP